jgi:fatty acid desaturase
MSTIDREFGFIGRHIFHGIVEYHVVHHLFPYVLPFPRCYVTLRCLGIGTRTEFS